MKISKSKVFRIAHGIKKFFTTWSEALKAAWAVGKLFFNRIDNIIFAKSTGEVREATVKSILKLDTTIAKGFVRFIELLPNGQTQFRSFRVERLILA